MRPRKAAIIDMGTNTFHLLLVEIFGEKYTTLFKEKVAVKIGQGGINQRIIQEDAQKRAFQTLKHFKNLIDGEGIAEIFAFATSAVRNAENGQAFVDKVLESIGIEINVIDGDQEAQMIYEGIRLSGALTDEISLMMDIGGGSVEFILGTQQSVLWKKSFEIGGQRMLDLFHYHDPILPEETQNLFSYLDANLQELTTAIHEFQPTRLVGASGTFDTLSDIYYATLHKHKAREEQVFLLPRSAFDEISNQLHTLPKEDRLKIPGMIPMRVDMIVVASCLIEYILKHLSVETLVCSNFALKEGAIAQLMGNDSLAVAE
jgi:exopolyphosphatase / guanosine-5'-triphosphate,3'-diphosphate pyrophosphatase